MLDVFDKVKKEYASISNELKEDLSNGYVDFNSKYSPDLLKTLEGEELLDKLFLGKGGTDNLCYYLERDKKSRPYGGIGGGNAAKSFQEMLEKTIAEYHERRKKLSLEEAGETQEVASENIIQNATEQALSILREMQENRESFRKMGLTFEEKAFYDILVALRDQYNFEYGTDKKVNGIIINDKCKSLAKKVKEIIDTKSSFADWLNNQRVRDQLKQDIKICLVKNGYPPQYSPEVFRKVMEQVENFEENA